MSKYTAPSSDDYWDELQGRRDIVLTCDLCGDTFHWPEDLIEVSLCDTCWDRTDTLVTADEAKRAE